MEAEEVLRIVLIVAAILTCGALMFVLFEAFRGLREVRETTSELRGRLVPLLDKVDVTVDAINAEMMRIDGVVSRFEEVSERVSSTTSAVHDVVNAPMETISAVGNGLRGVLTGWRRTRKR